MGKIFYHLVKKHNGRVSFNVLVYFLFTFILVRLFVYAWTYEIIPEIRVIIKEVHIHHLNYGIFLLAITGYWALVNRKEINRLRIAKLYGIGLALTFDEFGMWLHLQDDYWMRHSYDIVIVTLAVFLNIVYFSQLWQKVINKNVIFWKKFCKELLGRVYKRINT